MFWAAAVLHSFGWLYSYYVIKPLYDVAALPTGLDSWSLRRIVGSSSGALGSGSRLGAYVEALTGSLGHADRVAPFRSYCTGLLLPGARKSVEPMAARVEPGRVQAVHQSLHHFVAKADWSDEALLAAVRAHVLPVLEQ